jgi:hypothetical protein
MTKGVLFLVILIIILSIATINHLRSTKPDVLPEVKIYVKHENENI